MTIIHLKGSSDLRLEPYRDLPRANRSGESVRFIAEGRLLVKRLLASELTTESILCSERQLAGYRSLAAGPTPVYVVTDKVLQEIVGFQFHRGVMACGRRPSNPPLTDLLEGTGNRRLLVVCPQIADPTNLAGVIRNCSAFGADGLLLGQHCADPFSRRVVRVSMGAVFQLPVRVANDLAADLQWLHTKAQYCRIGTVLDDSARPLQQVACPHRLAILFGSEGHGLADAWLKHCDELTTLAMQRNADSLNLATSSGVFLYHFTQVARLALDKRFTQ